MCWCSLSRNEGIALATFLFKLDPRTLERTFSRSSKDMLAAICGSVKLLLDGELYAEANPDCVTTLGLFRRLPTQMISSIVFIIWRSRAYAFEPLDHVSETMGDLMLASTWNYLLMLSQSWKISARPQFPWQISVRPSPSLNPKSGNALPLGRRSSLISLFRIVEFQKWYTWTHQSWQRNFHRGSILLRDMSDRIKCKLCFFATYPRSPYRAQRHYCCEVKSVVYSVRNPKSLPRVGRLPQYLQLIFPWEIVEVTPQWREE